MNINTSPNPVRHVRNRGITIAITLLLLFAAESVASGQSESNPRRVATVTLGPNQIALIRTAAKISTRISFTEPVKQIICGDLYDPESGMGSFVIQRFGNDVFIKPVVASGTSNMFVRTGENGENIYNFSLEIHPPQEAQLIVNVRSLEAGIVPAKGQPRERSGSSLRPPSPVRFGTIADSLDRGSTPPGLSGNMLASGLLDAPPPPTNANKKSNGVLADRTDNRVGIQAAAIKKVAPTYPEFAKAVGASGEVEVEVIVDEGGKVISAKALSGHIRLREAAVSAARYWRFNPTKVNGVPVQAIGKIMFHFEKPADQNFDGLVGFPGAARRRP